LFHPAVRGSFITGRLAEIALKKQAGTAARLLP